MSATDDNAQTVRPKRRRLRILLAAGGVLIALVVVAWFVLSSELFFKRVILPKAGKAMNASVTVEAAQIKPFTQVVLSNLKLQPNGTEPALLEAREVRVRYDALKLIHGRIRVEEIFIDSPILTVVENADGSCNIDPLTTTEDATEPAPQAPEPEAPPNVLVGSFQLTNATLRYARTDPGGTRDRVEVTGLNVALHQVGNGQAGRLQFDLNTFADLHTADSGRHGSLKARSSGDYRFTLGEDLVPTDMEGTSQFHIVEATGTLKALTAFKAESAVKLTPTEIQQGILQLSRNADRLGELQMSGPFEAAKREGTLAVELIGIDHRALNLVGAIFGLDFGSTTIRSTNTLTVTDGGRRLALQGALHVARLQVSRGDRTTPVLDLEAAYDLAERNASAQVTLSMPPTRRAPTNAATVRVDLHEPTASELTGALKLTADTLDLSDWIEPSADTGAPDHGSPSPSPLPEQESEPQPVTLPLKRFDAQASLGSLWVRDVVISDFRAAASLNGGIVVVEPVSFGLNKGTVTGSASVNLGVPGWEYRLSLEGTGVEIAPFADSFLPEYRDAAHGRALARLQLNGSGVTTPNLVKHLHGNVQLGLSDGSLRISATPRTTTARLLRAVLIAVGRTLRLPELLEEPIASFGADVAIGDAQLNIRTLDLASQSFRFQSRGTVSLSPDLTNSTLNGFPVELSLSRALAGQAGLVGRSQMQTPYVDLGQLATVTGTLNDPKTTLDKARITLLTARSLGQLEGIKGTEVGNVLQGLGDLMEGNRGTNQTGETNATGQPGAEAVQSVLRGIGGLIGRDRSGSTNSAESTEPPKE